MCTLTKSHDQHVYVHVYCSQYISVLNVFYIYIYVCISTIPEARDFKRFELNLEIDFSKNQKAENERYFFV